MSVDTHELRELLLQSDQEFRELALKHHELDDRLHDLATRAFPVRIRTTRRSPAEEAEAASQGQDGRHPRRHRRLSAVSHCQSPVHAPVAGLRWQGPLSVRRPLLRVRPWPAPRDRIARMRIDPAGWPFVLGALVPRRSWWLARDIRSGPCRWLVLGGFFLYFFRDPERADRGRRGRRRLAGRRPRRRRR